MLLIGVHAHPAQARQPTLQKETSMKTHALATFAGGCFWCMQPAFDETPGVLSTSVGYTGGTTVNPTYEQVCSGTTGHAESIQVTYDPEKVGYPQLLEVFWHNVNPTTPNQQFADVGTQYRTAIFYHTEDQRRQATAAKEQLGASGKFSKPIVTESVAATTFYPAEEYHQHYYKKNYLRYKLYKAGSGREDYLKKTWGK